MSAFLALLPTDELSQPYSPLFLLIAAVGLIAFVALVLYWLTVCAIPNQQVGVVEKLWSARGSVPEGSIIALNGEAGYQADLLRGGLHFGLWRWQYRVHKRAARHHPAGQDRLRLRPRRRIAAAQPDARPRRALQQLPGRPRLPRRGRRRRRGDHARPARPAARHPPRRRLRHQPGPVRGHHRGRRLPAAAPARHARGRGRGRLAAAAERRGRLQSRGGRRPRPRRRPAPARPDDQRGQHRHRHGAGRPVAGRPARSSPRPSATTPPTPTTTTTIRTPRRSCGPAAAAAGSTCR